MESGLLYIEKKKDVYLYKAQLSLRNKCFAFSGVEVNKLYKQSN